MLRKRMCVANRKRGCNYLINVSIQVDFLVTPGEIAYLCTKTPSLPGQRCVLKISVVTTHPIFNLLSLKMARDINEPITYQENLLFQGFPVNISIHLRMTLCIKSHPKEEIYS